MRRLYYAVKPFLPWRVRMGLRRMLARRKLNASKEVWPVDPAAATPPPGWNGWPEGKRFSFVLTHDVEGVEGLAKCRQLAELEMEMGVRSSFNFIPEGEYKVPKELRDWLIANGFEVGIHDLRHDGKLFQSHSSFRLKAARINQYAREWGATGFRAGFMLRNLDWYHQLDISYDASTFDTDPFEPQPDGARTIFPFWVPAITGQAERPGYVELPYTLPQDFSLFLLLREKSPEIWLKKLDWIAQNGGMSLVIVHPDYLCFEGEKPHAHTFPVSHYRALLKHVRDHHAGKYWQALPREVANFAAQSRPQHQALRPKRIGMVTHSVYSGDSRVMRYAESLAARGDQVEVFSLRRSDDLPKEGALRGVRIFRIQDRFAKLQKTKLGFLMPLIRFLVVSTWHLTRRHSRQRYDLIHIHNIPDFLVFAAWYPKLTGTPVILDIHDVVPEFFSSKFGQKQSGLVFGGLKLMERLSAMYADHIILGNHLWLDTYAVRTRSRARCTAMINNVDTTLFKPDPAPRNDGKLVVLFPGGLQWHQGLDIAIRAFPRVVAELPNAEFQIYGDGNARDDLIALTRELGLQEKVHFFAPRPVNEIVPIMARADLGVVPKRADSFGNEAYSTKIMEFMSVGVAVVISSTKIDRYYFDDTVVRFFESGNVDALARNMIELLRNESLRRAQIKNALVYAAENSWTAHKHVYLGLVDRLCSSVTLTPWGNNISYRPPPID
jgi:glycosyltransferase involved in cell wall biosynthesis